MLTRRKAIVRSALCLLLGAVTTWAVAWGITAAAWRGWIEPPAEQRPIIFHAWDHRLFTRVTGHGAMACYKGWRITRLTTADPESRQAQAQLQRWLAPPEEYQALYPTLSLDEAEREKSSIVMQRLELEGEFGRCDLAPWLGDAVLTTLVSTSVGWPCASASSVEVREAPNMARGSHWALNTGIWQHPDDWTGTPVSLTLPLRPIWPGFLLDTGFYGILWALPLFSLPLLKQSCRKRKGRCPNCAYDLKRDFQSGCPECGWRR